jgi:hypothetical protein
VPAANRAYGDKLAILAGDFLLARASVGLARLRNVEVSRTRNVGLVVGRSVGSSQTTVEVQVKAIIWGDDGVCLVSSTR